MDAKKLIDIIAPEHDRTSCSDEKLYNGVYSNTHFTRCNRCVLLQIVKENKLPASHTFNGSFSIEAELAENEYNERQGY